MGIPAPGHPAGYREIPGPDPQARHLALNLADTKKPAAMQAFLWKQAIYLRTAKGDGRLASQAEIFLMSAGVSWATIAPMIAFLRVLALARAPAAPRLYERRACSR